MSSDTQLKPVCFVVNLPYGPSTMAVVPFAERDAAEQFADAWLARVDVPAESVSIGPMYAGGDVLRILD